jgi:phage terminase large subunit-like protein
VAKAGSRDDPITAYARSISEGAVPANRMVRLACERHLDHLAEGAGRGLRFDLAAARHAIEFFGFLRHSKGEWAGLTFELAPWQAFIVGALFGWKRNDGLRRFRTAYCAVPRKNGKSSIAAGIGLYLLSPTASRAPRSTPPRPPAIRRGSCSTGPSAWSPPRLRSGAGSTR